MQPDPKNATIKASRETMDRIGSQLLSESKADIANQKTSWTRRDLLSLLLRANVSTDLPASQRMSDQDVLARKHHIYFSKLRLLILILILIPNCRGPDVFGCWTRDDKVGGDLFGSQAIAKPTVVPQRHGHCLH